MFLYPWNGPHNKGGEILFLFFNWANLSMPIRFDFLIYFLLCKSLNILGSEVEYDLRFLQDRDVTYAELESHRNYRDGLWTALDGVP